MEPYAARRAALIAQMRARGGGVAIIPTAPEVKRNGDSDYPYRHDSYFYYLTGFSEPDAALVLVGNKTARAILFCRARNPESEIWDGFRHGPEAAREQFGFDAAYPSDTLDAEMPKLIANAPALFYALGGSPQLDAQVHNWLRTVRSQTRIGVSAPPVVHNVHVLLDEMRLVKDAHEIDLMRRAAAIAANAHRRAMRMSRPGLAEYQVEAELLHEFRSSGAEAPAYPSIVASGANACVLHYQAGSALLRDGDLVLIDAGCEFGGYASDISRTYPANGVFSGPQKALYEIVLAAQAAAFAAIAPGKSFIAPHEAAVRVLTQGMLDTGLLDKDKVGSLDDAIEKGEFRKFYMHRTSHWLGMDVHDVGDYRVPHLPANGHERPWRELQAGMVLTVEPGLYVRRAPDVPEPFWNIGIRIEDDAAVTPDGCDILTAAAPKTVAEIEAVMKR
jgi:Xaa-Pro aminopeptidase